MRSLEKPLRWWQYIIIFLGGNIKRDKLINDVRFLEYLRKLEIVNPKPVYKIPEEYFITNP